ncbi:MAG TPA: isochorismatase family protein [Candidatus Dormibacteraeota bacterium]|nr:isochorismatase family protein [Candidatus Dormibacteraeota bacterium]
MPITKLDDVAGLVVIDLQKGIVSLPTVHPTGEIIERAARMVRAFRKRGLPVVLVNVTGGAPGRTDAAAPKYTRPPDWAQFVAELEPQAGDYVVSKQSWGAFHGTPLDGYLRQRGVTQILLAGVATSIGVESTARSAYDLGYHVVLVTDAMTDRDAEAHRHTVEKIFPRMGESGTTEDVLKLVEK